MNADAGDGASNHNKLGRRPLVRNELKGKNLLVHRVRVTVTWKHSARNEVDDEVSSPVGDDHAAWARSIRYQRWVSWSSWARGRNGGPSR